MFGTADDEEPVEKIIMTSSSAFIISQDSVNNNFVIIMVDSGASDNLFDDAIIRDLKHCLQGYAHHATHRKILTARGALLDVTADSVLQGLTADNYGNQILVRVDTVVVHGMGRNLFSVITAAKKGIVAIFGHENSRLEEFNVTVLLRRESGDLYLFVLNLSADGYSVKELATNAVANAQVRHGGWVIPIYGAWIFYASEMVLASHLRELSRTATFVPWERLNSLLTSRQPTTRSTGLSGCATGT